MTQSSKPELLNLNASRTAILTFLKSSWGHEYKNALTGLQGFGMIINRQLKSSPSTKDSGLMLHQQIDRVINQFRDFDLFTNLFNNTLELEWTEISMLPLLKSLNGNKSGFQLNLPNESPHHSVLGDHMLLSRAFLEVFTFLFKRSPGQPIAVLIRETKDYMKTICSVDAASKSAGIPSSQPLRLSSGIQMAALLFEKHGGTLTIKGHTKTKLEVQVELPVESQKHRKHINSIYNPE